MNKLTFLLVIAALYSLGCAQEAERFEQDPNVVLQSQAILLQPPVVWNAGSQMAIIQGKFCVINGTGTSFLTLCSKSVTVDVTADGKGGYIYSNLKNDTAMGGCTMGNCVWGAGAIFGITANGHALGVISGTGTAYLVLCNKTVTVDVTADGKGGCIYSNLKNDTAMGGCTMGNCVWGAGAIFGITANGHALGIISGTGKIYIFEGTGKNITGNVTADGEGGCVYSNVENDTMTGEYCDGLNIWKSGAIIGITHKGKRIGVLSGSGKLDYFASGAHVTGDVKANGKGEFVYSNVSNGTTTSEYWDGVSMWKAGATLGIIDKCKSIGVLSGTRKSDYK